ncbi:stage III sporulation protein AA [Desulfitobacterium metallireducens]|uniref:Stage III sporulation protein AA n=1 Tax=Desulfitobacterium metallireducens DSM 15288 TaxID=871968 RepID=W0E9G9_9FIRM|nr:stage III sporulation protein AA [Desulfitobacterium metallireducens]AHF07412.1 stage III sporulation protein AA [Desulfitobacterium metallireducens DSM 15288]
MSLRYSLVSIHPEKEDKMNRLEAIVKWLSDPLRDIFAAATGLPLSEIEEIRLRTSKPLLLQGKDSEYFLDAWGKSVSSEKAYHVQREDLMQTLERMTQSSLYAAEDELRQGYITLPGGHRVGVTGEVTLKQGMVQNLKHISGLNIRLALEISGQAPQILPRLIRADGSLYHTLILSPPRAGKTTLLRDLIRCISDGVPNLSLKGQTVGVVDERGEIAGMWQGHPSYNLGCRTDILDGCPKAIGMSMLIRSMSPRVVAVDELGHPQDVEAVLDALRTGVSVLSTAHAESGEEAKKRPVLKALFASGVFERLVILSRRKGPGTVESIFDLKNQLELRRD